MAVDEAAGVHEMFIKPTQWLRGHERPSGIFHYRWIISGIAIVVVVVLSYLKFFLHLSSDTKAILYRCRCFSRRRVGHRNDGKLLRWITRSEQFSALHARSGRGVSKWQA